MYLRGPSALCPPNGCLCQASSNSSSAAVPHQSKAAAIASGRGEALSTQAVCVCVCVRARVSACISVFLQQETPDAAPWLKEVKDNKQQSDKGRQADSRREM